MDIEAIKGLGITDEAIAAKVADAFASSVAGLKAQQKTLLDEKKALAEKYKDVDVEEYAALKKGKGADNSLKSQLDDLRKLIADRDAAIKQRDERNMQTYVEAQIEKSISEHNGIPNLLRRELLAKVKGVDNNGTIELNIIGNDGKVRLNDKGGAFTISDLLNEMKKSDDWAAGFKASGHSGGGATNTNRGASGGTVLRRSQFDSLSPVEKMQHIKGGGKVTD